MNADLNLDDMMDFEDVDMNSSGIDIDLVECIPDIIINSFEQSTLPDIQDYHAFFLTKATNNIFSDMRKCEFLKCLKSSPCWKLYLSEVMYGLLLLEAPWANDFPSNFLQTLKAEQKIIVLPKDLPVTIPISQTSQRVTNCRSLSVTFLRHGKITQMLEFEMGKSDGTYNTCSHMGTSIIEDIISGGSEQPCRGFPKVFKEFIEEEVRVSDSDASESSTSSSSSSLSNPSRTSSISISPSTADLAQSFSSVLDSIRQRLRKEEELQFKIVTYGGDKLVNLWYMKHIAEEFRCQVHVNEKYFNFVKSCLPEFAHAFSPTNSDGFCRFHFNCSNSWGLEFEEGCAPSFEDPQDFQVDFVWIGFWVDQVPKNIRIPKSSLCIPYIHEVIYDF